MNKSIDIQLEDLVVKKTGRVNAAITRREWFLKSNLYKEILEKTKILDGFKHAYFGLRILYLLGKIDIKKCPKCDTGLYFEHGIRHFQTCKCKTNYNKQSYLKFKTTIQNKQQNLKQQFIEFYKTFNNNETFINDYTQFINNKIKVRKNINISFIFKNFNLIAGLIKSTEKIIPFDIDNLRLTERLYLYYYKLTSIPVCRYCGKPVGFNTFFKGYSICCKNCAYIYTHEKMMQKNIEQIKEIYSKKFDILNDGPLYLYDKIKFKCKKCGHIFERKLNNGRLGMELFCPNCEYIASRPQREIFEYIKTIYSGKIMENYRVAKDKNNARYFHEIDIYLPDLNLGFEFNGSYWHCFPNKPKKYHQEKTMFFKERGILIYHIFEYEYGMKKQLILDKIRFLLHTVNNKIFARKCIVKNITNKICKDFCDKYHIQGGCNSSINLGLFCSDNLVGVMSFSKRRFDKKEGYELVRYCTINDSRVIGGAGKLFKYFIRQFNPTNIVSYANIKVSPLGNLYHQLGFKYIKITPPNYVYWCNHTNSILSRISCQKHKLSKLLEHFDPNKTEEQNMIDNGYCKIYDCGNYVFEWTKTNTK